MQHFFNTGPCRRTADAVWRGKVRGSVHRHRGLSAGEVMWDISKCYENISFEVLVDRALRVGYPPSLLRLTVGLYRMPRYLTDGALIIGPVCPRWRAVVAGCGTAPYELKALLVADLCRFEERWPEGHLLVHVDDLAFGAAARGLPDLCGTLAGMANDLAAVCQELRLPLAPGKACTVATTPRALRGIVKALGPFGRCRPAGGAQAGGRLRAGRPGGGVPRQPNAGGSPEQSAAA